MLYLTTCALVVLDNWCVNSVNPSICDYSSAHVTFFYPDMIVVDRVT